jgi:hypothetical protein
MVAYVLCDRVIECVQKRGKSLPGRGCSGFLRLTDSQSGDNVGLEMGSWEVAGACFVCFYSSLQTGNW